MLDPSAVNYGIPGNKPENSGIASSACVSRSFVPASSWLKEAVLLVQPVVFLMTSAPASAHNIVCLRRAGWVT